MKKLTTLLGIVLILSLVMSMGIASALAENEPTGSISILKSELNTVYDFYRILSLTGQDMDSTDGKDEYTAVAYTVTDKWAGFFSGTAAGVGYLIAEADATDEQKAGLSQLLIDGSVFYLNLTDETVAAFANDTMAYALSTPVDSDTSTTGTGSVETPVKVENLPLGYYLMIPVDAANPNANSKGSVASLTSTIPNAEIKVKAEKPKIEKTDNVISADVGQAVTYTVTGTVPNTAGYSTYLYQISDTMTSGLTFNKDVAVKIEGVTDPVTSQCEIDYTEDPQGFTCTIPVAALQGKDGANVGKTITLTYTATVNENAVASAQEKNTAKLDYGHDPNKLKHTEPVSEEVYTAKISVYKYTGVLADAQYAAQDAYADAAAAAADGYSKYEGEDASAGKFWVKPASAGSPLAGAKFALMNSEGKYYKYTAASGNTPAKVEWVTVASAPTDGTAAVTDAQARALANASGITTITTTAQGTGEFRGVKDGTYFLVEFASPAGYNRLEKPQSVTVAGTNVDTEDMENKAQAAQEVFDSANDVTANVLNQGGTVLPGTGGIGTTLFYVVGGVLVLAAVVLLITKKRMGGD